MGKQVAIIGAGISGLLAYKYTLSKGFRPIVFENSSCIGGFSDFPWPSSMIKGHPDQNQVLNYIQSYAQHFDLLKHIKFNSNVSGIDHRGSTGEPFSSEGKWKVVVEDKQSLSTKVHTSFHGEVIHSMNYADMDYESAAKFVEGKQVTVVGFQKFAMDIAMECSTANGVENPCTVLYKTEHWNLPGYLPWGFPIAYLYFNRFSELLVHKPGEGILLSLLATILSPVRWGFSKFVESYINKKLGLAKYGMVPKHSFHQEISSCMIATHHTEKVSWRLGFCQEGILVNGESSPVKSDLVILATGFRGEKKLKDMFVSPTFQDNILGSPKSILLLYRECIHGRISQLSVIGFSESISNLYTSKMRCKRCGKIRSIREAKRYTSSQYYRRSCTGALHLWYNDQLCKDMGWNPKRKKGLFAELFEPYGPMDYASS
ncbi:unnamed protein product [Malus baccata var. baccata]